VTNFRYEFDDEYEELKKNTVSSKGQLTPDRFVTFDNPEGNGQRVLFLGNSITRHGKAPQIGWNFDHGMAASSIDKDYVHLTMSAIREKDPDAAICICQAADFERMYRIGDSVQHAYSAAKAFKPDVIVMRLAENVPTEKFDGELFGSMLSEFLRYLGGDDVKVIFTTSFWKHPADESIRKLAAKQGAPLVELGDLGQIPEMKALGLFEHTGVANHPSDEGMKAISDRILDAYFNKF
jgi:alpha-galactosidase